jgi:hypothetical protein
MRLVVSVWILWLGVSVCCAFAVARVSLPNQNVSPLRSGKLSSISGERWLL